ncbi:MAG: hypothetical protein QE494_03130 [Ramlibacter sp.]|uniref:hypothetical protein n=1 Tax=Ramlibacter sp. TaxID=1917967 RepID=UPI00260D3C3C|nr:hypothetical protein [Ramlibacter sp.]MDH4375275.1 hypothetical protein [Ramlibacter sp.]
MRHTIARIIEAPQSPSARRWRDPPRNASDLGVKVGDGGARNGSARLFGFGTIPRFWGLGCAVAMDDQTVGTMAETDQSVPVPEPWRWGPGRCCHAKRWLHRSGTLPEGVGQQFFSSRVIFICNNDKPRKTYRIASGENPSLSGFDTDAMGESGRDKDTPFCD